MSKKGFAMQFNWLFVLIAGIIILAFFISLINNLSHGEEERKASKATQALDDVFKVSTAARNTEKTIEFNQKLSFFCNPEQGISYYAVEGSPITRSYDYEALFSPAELDSRELLVKNMDFEQGFRIMPLVFATSRDVEYVFADRSEGPTVVKMLYSTMPANSTRMMIAPSAISSHPDNNYDLTVFVLPEQELSSLDVSADFIEPETGGSRARAVVVKPSPDMLGIGTLDFYEYDAGAEEFVLAGSGHYLGFETALGGIISSYPDIYNCNLEKAVNRLRLLAQMHLQRTEYYEFRASLLCKEYYVDARTRMNRLIQDLDYESQLSYEKAYDIKNSLQELEAINNQLSATECPVLW